MKNRRLLILALVASNLIALASCGDNKNSNSVSVPVSESSTDITSESEISSVEESASPSEAVSEITSFVFEGITVQYDGNAHSIEVQDLPEGYSVVYDNNGQTEPGKHLVVATITLPSGKTKKKTAYITIEKAPATISADAVQAMTNNGGALPTFNLSNSEQEVSVAPIYREGVFELDLYAKESDHYLESNHVKVTLTVTNASVSGVTFPSLKCKYDGENKTVEAANIPAGYHVEYENNVAKDVGKHVAACKVYDANNQLECTLNAIIDIDNVDNADFNVWCDDFLLEYLGNDYLSWNIFAVHPENFGFEREDGDVATWYTYESYQPTDKEDAYNEFKDIYDELVAFDTTLLSKDQMVSYRNIKGFLSTYMEYYNPENDYDMMMTLRYIDQFGGYPADFSTYMEAYEFRATQDIEDALSYIKSLPEAFDSYCLFAQDRINANYPISDYTLDEMIGYLDSVQPEEGKTYYLVDVLQNKITNCEFLSDADKQTYKERIADYVSTYLLPAYADLADDLENYKGHCEVEGYYAAYGELGKKQYEYDLKDLLGFDDLSMESYGSYLENKVSEYSNEMDDLLSQLYAMPTADYNRGAKFATGGSITGIKDVNKMIDYLKVFAKTIVPDLEVEPEIQVKYMDDAQAEVSNAVAYYMKSPLDSDNLEHITLNKKKLSSDLNDTLSTMAHEGYPGHLYAYLYDKQLNISNASKIMTSTAHGEGWATYVQLKLYEYMKEGTNDNAAKWACDYLACNEKLAYTAYAYWDYMIHYEGASVNDVKDNMNSIGFNGDAAGDLYKTLIEIPTTYAAYGYGMDFYLDLHNKAKMELGVVYNEIDFNACILSEGWVSLGRLQDIVDEYIADQKVLYSNILNNK